MASTDTTRIGPCAQCGLDESFWTHHDPTGHPFQSYLRKDVTITPAMMQYAKELAVVVGLEPRDDRRMVARQDVAWCPTCQHVYPIDDRVEQAIQIRCPRGHWTWEDGNYCRECGIVLKEWIPIPVAPPSMRNEPC